MCLGHWGGDWAEFPRRRSERREEAGVRGWGAGHQAAMMPSPPARRSVHFHGRKREKNDSGTRGNFSNQLLVRQRKCFLMFRLIIDQHVPDYCFLSADTGLPLWCWGSSGTPGVVVTPH